jgi:Ca2+-binding EF-hand superfamily protein
LPLSIPFRVCPITPVLFLLSEQLFRVFDAKNTGFVDWDEFISGLAVACRGNAEEKLKFAFECFDLRG